MRVPPRAKASGLPALISMIIGDYDLEVFTPHCSPGSEQYVAIARLTADISNVLPYMNATLNDVAYYPAADALTWKYENHSVTFGAFQIAFTDLDDRAEAVHVIERLVEQINHVWERRDEITPDFGAQQRPKPLAVYELMPRTNCKACGEPTCYVFAMKLIAGQRQLAGCPALAEPEYSGNLSALGGLLGEA